MPQSLNRMLLSNFLFQLRAYLRGIYTLTRIFSDVIALMVRDHLWDTRYGVETSVDFSNSERSGSNGDGYRYMPTAVGALKKIMARVRPGKDDILVDLGCGKGRVVFFVSMLGVKKVVGVELDKGLFEAAVKNRAVFRRNTCPIELVNDDAANYRFKDETFFFFFNPFGEKTLRQVVCNIRDSLSVNPRRVCVVYHSPQHKECLEGQDWLIPEKGIPGQSWLVFRNKRNEG